jgi:hypothetical protein
LCRPLLELEKNEIRCRKNFSDLEGLTAAMAVVDSVSMPLRNDRRAVTLPPHETTEGYIECGQLLYSEGTITEPDRAPGVFLPAVDLNMSLYVRGQKSACR